jgi:hypothetical protein
MGGDLAGSPRQAMILVRINDVAIIDVGKTPALLGGG